MGVRRPGQARRGEMPTPPRGCSSGNCPQKHGSEPHLAFHLIMMPTPLFYMQMYQDKPAASQVTVWHFLGRWNFAPFDADELIYVCNLRKHSYKPGCQACAMSGPSTHVTLKYTSISSPHKLEGKNQGLLHSNYYCCASPPRTGL